MAAAFTESCIHCRELRASRSVEIIQSWLRLAVFFSSLAHLRFAKMAFLGHFPWNQARENSLNQGLTGFGRSLRHRPNKYGDTQWPRNQSNKESKISLLNSLA